MSTTKMFPYKGREIYSETKNDGGIVYGYIANQSEANRIESKYGSKSVFPIYTPGTFVILLGGYQKGSITPRGFDPGLFDAERFNGDGGISNVDLQRDIFDDKNFKKMATGGSSPNTAQKPPESGSQTSPGSDPNVQNTSNLILTYPIGMEYTIQDRIKFSVFEINKLSEDQVNNSESTFYSFSPPENQNKDYKPVANSPTVFLPIQPSITDSNSVDWGEGKLNEIERQAAKVALIAMNKGFSAAAAEAGNIYETLSKKKFEGLKTLGQIALTEQAVGIQGLLSRATGQVLNPNLELLFQGPTLRPFSFTFKLSPRSGDEATRVKEIIKFFKKNMAVRKVEGNLFLKSPYVFGIEYLKLNAVKDSHRSINLIKKCALRSCNVDYTPLGSYMTYDDDNHTMVSYTISLQFQEIVPVYQDDYDNHPIGF